MIKYLKKLLRPLKYIFPLGYSQLSYGQEGEDLILQRAFLGKRKGFYIDIGAHHPYRFSNTYIFYKSGWRGINIDPLPGGMKLFHKKRPNDVNLEIGISEVESTLNYNIFDEPTLNGFSEDQTLDYQNNTNYKLIGVIPVKVYPLSVILDKYCSNGQVIDFMTIDVEGFDLNVLKSNNWSKYRPKIVLVESHKTNIENLEDCPIYMFMKSQNYSLYGKSVLTYFYIDKRYGNTSFIDNI